ncbi:MAG: thiolase family protein [SAR324 cluster bacterium]|nr:thiolase family protein [SAR324 cluster bacterium]
MALEKAFIPYGGYWSTPFVKWQGSFANLHPVKFAAEMTQRALAERNIAPNCFSDLFFGMTVPSINCFYGAPWLAGLIGAEGITGPTFAQACATSARLMGSAAFEMETNEEEDRAILCITADRTSNGPHLNYPNPLGPGGRGDSEDWVWDNFQFDPFARNGMLQTAENVARESRISTEEQHEAVLLRHHQYKQALENDASFHKKYMLTPVEIKPGKKVVGTVVEDEGIFPTTKETLSGLRPVMPDGTVTFGAQTFPADGNSGIIISSQKKAAEWSRDSGIEIQLLAFAQGRAEKGFMPKANLPAVHRVLERAGLSLGNIKAIKTHNPFAVNDCFLSRELNIPLADVNNYGSSLIWGHPQGPTGMRSIIELIEELVMRGGGNGLFTGCAAGDTAAAIVLKVDAPS